MLTLIALAGAAPLVAPMTELPVFHRIEASDLTLIEVPESLVHPHALQRVEDAVGRIALEPLLAGEPLREERLGTDARSTLLGPDDDLVLLPLSRPEQWAPGRVDLVAVTSEGACMVAEDVRSHGTSEPGLMALAARALDAHQLRWAISQLDVVPLARNPIDRGRSPQLHCGGGLPANEVRVAAQAGTLLRLGEPFQTLVVSHTQRATAEAVTTTDVWMHGVEEGRTAASLFMADGPPILVDLLVGPPLQPAQTLVVGGLGVIALPGVSEARVWPQDAATTTLSNGKLLVQPHQAGVIELWTRTEAGDMALHGFTVIDGWPAPQRGEAVLAVAPGKRRKVTMPGTVVSVWTGSPTVALATTKGGKALITGQAPGTTEVVLLDDTGQTSSVRVVVLEKGRP
jgi:hypothetical protein